MLFVCCKHQSGALIIVSVKTKHAKDKGNASRDTILFPHAANRTVDTWLIICLVVALFSSVRLC